MSLVGLESAFPKIERLQTPALDHMVTSIGSLFALLSSNFIDIYIVIYVQTFLLLLF
jgi:hypothetical protein